MQPLFVISFTLEPGKWETGGGKRSTTAALVSVGRLQMNKEDDDDPLIFARHKRVDGNIN